MTCRYHDEPVETCMACVGHWHATLAERLLREGASAASFASALRFAIAEIAFLERVRDADATEGELEPARADAFRVHLGTCESCQRDLEGHMQLDAQLSELAAAREPTRDR